MGRNVELLALLGLWMLVGVASSALDLNGKRTYIIRMDVSSLGTMGTHHTRMSWYNQVLQSAKQGTSTLSLVNDATVSDMLHVYDNVFYGFSAQLTSQQAVFLEGMSGVLGVYPDSVKQLHTTHTPEFLGLNSMEGIWPESHFGDDVIVGVLDTGVWPESFSFRDNLLGPVPARWKGICQAGVYFNASDCNKKLIGARYYVKGYEAATGPLNETIEFRSPRDQEGHGTHTSSTAAGRWVYRASLNGLANGTARGMAPRARVAVYKVCWEGGCYDSDILAAFDQAVKDGVNVISLSVGGGAVPYYQDSIAIGAFGAVRQGVFVSCSAGNSGPTPFTVTNIAPWVMTVGASTLDRDFPANVVLGDGETIRGVSLYRGAGINNGNTSLIYGGDAALNNVTEASLCMDNALNPALVKGKIVLCERGVNGRVAKGEVVLTAGGAGMILANTATDGEGLIADDHILPATMVGAKGGVIILAYIRATVNPVAKIDFKGTQLGVKPAPVVASFSSRGPNQITPEVLKPDITAPGVNILASWTGNVGPTGLAIDTRRVKYNIISGTSMSCPHISGLGALLKGAHPTWSPAAIKSAMMTTANILDNSNGLLTDESTSVVASPFDYGSGAVRPDKAVDPGLIYDLVPQDYVNFLCASNYTAKTIQIFTNQPVSCPKTSVRIEDMNYPSFSAVFKQAPSTKSITTTFTRTVTNVGPANSAYSANIASPKDVNITVKPDKLTFSAVNEKKTFTVYVTTVNAPSSVVGVSVTEFAYLAWSDGKHVVQSPISITTQK